MPFASVMGQDRVPEQVLVQSDQARVIADVAPIIPGHTLIVTDAHVSSVANCSSDEMREIRKLKSEIGPSIEEAFGIPPVWFEHGECSDSESDSCRVYHAHLHALPTLPTVFDSVLEQYPFRPVNGIDDLAEVAGGQSYLYVETAVRGAFVAVMAEPPSQILRKTVCEALNLFDRWNWHDQIILRPEETRSRIEITLEKLAYLREWR